MLRTLLLALLMLPLAASAQPVSFPSVAVGSSSAGPEIKGWIYTPPVAGPFPAIILAHSCAGAGEHTKTWGRRLAGWGYLTLAPDSFGPRGEKQVCSKPGVVTPNMRVADIAGALDFLATRSDVIPGRIGLIGHSHGGSTTVRSSQRSFGLAERGLRAGVAYYPGCSPAFDREVDVPLLILIGDKDDWTLADRCRNLQASGFIKPDLVEVKYYPNAYHSFDSTARDRIVPGAAGKMHQLAYDPDATPDAEARTRAFFDRILR